jgi:hypothetical protein
LVIFAFLIDDLLLFTSPYQYRCLQSQTLANRQKTKGRDIAIAIAVLTGLPIGIAVLGVVVLFLGMITGKLQWWA